MWVNPVKIQSPNFKKKVLESLFFKNFHASKPNFLGRINVFPSTMAPAELVEPSNPSVLIAAKAAWAAS